MFYRDTEHKNNLLALLDKHGFIYTDGHVDSEYAAAYYLLTGNWSVWEKAKTYVDSSGIEFLSMTENESFSSGEFSIVKLAGNLFNGSFGDGISPKALISTLDRDNFRLAMAAMEIRNLGSLLNIGNLEESKCSCAVANGELMDSLGDALRMLRNLKCAGISLEINHIERVYEKYKIMRE